MKSKTKSQKSQVDPFGPREKFSKVRAWHECLFHFARHLDGKKWDVLHKHKIYYLSRGQFYCRKTDLAKRWGWSRSKVQRFFTRKEQAKELIQELHYGVGTIITIIDYDQAQEDYYK